MGGGGGGVVKMRNVAECHARRIRLPQSLPPGGGGFRAKQGEI